ncbi:MAG TPA: trypsin-like peptidase domain-containing protein, partial [Verrucomicrobiae bacterium]
MNMTSAGEKKYSFLANAVLLLVCVLSGASCERRAVVEEDIRRNATVRVIEEVMPSVVNIATAKKVDYEDINGGLFPQYFQTPQDRFSIGSGVIIDEAGYILTSFHVVPPRVSRIQVKLWNGHLYECDPIVATSYSDVALLKIHLNPGEKLKAIKFAQDDDVLLGETVLALGDPLGLGGTVTKGILSSKVRRLP